MKHTAQGAAPVEVEVEVRLMSHSRNELCAPEGECALEVCRGRS